MCGEMSLLFIIVLSCVVNAQWETKMHSSDYVTGFEVITINETIVIESFSATTCVNCMYRCSRVTSMRSVYYDTNSTVCYCNNDTDVTAIKVANASSIRYSFLSEKYELQYNNGEKRLLDGLHGMSSKCTDVQPKVKNGNKSVKNQRQNTQASAVLECEEDWTVFQRRMDGTLTFNQGWKDYTNGFGSPSGEYWLGLDNLHELTKNGSCELYIYLEAETSNSILQAGYARYSFFQVGGADTNYALNVSGFDGTVADSFMVPHNGMQFSTKKKDNDLDAGVDCADLYQGGWWYNSCLRSNLNGLYLNGSHGSLADEGIAWVDTWGHYYSLLKTEMKIRCL